MDTEDGPRSSKADGPKQDGNISAKSTKGSLHDKQKKKLGTSNKARKRRKNDSKEQELLLEKKMVICKECGRWFSHADNLMLHQQQIHLRVPKVTCYECGETFLRKSQLIRHEQKHLKDYCGVKSISMDKNKKHRRVEEAPKKP
ncbi:hypothetical protein GDO78_005403 [Eleutherodactylus coqui]|uniref:C2H2-type domain-containing protein n=1 Tax=Eleutherodactylus coqui TaxID=57060 RepID=A0A8J6FKV5_ELECQ|nr:hypothetical protein GDO78_005403 [Eleutherodactylus coqui]